MTDSFVEAFKSSFEKISDSDVFMSLVTENYLNDAICALQLGIAITLNKPIYLVVKKGTEVPEKLRIIADRIKVFDSIEDLKSVVNDLKNFAG